MTYVSDNRNVLALWVYGRNYKRIKTRTTRHSEVNIVRVVPQISAVREQQKTLGRADVGE